MRKLALIYASLFSIAAFAGSLEKDYQKIASKFDVPIEVRNLSDVSNQDYWNAFLNKNEAYIKHITDMGKDKSLEKQAKQVLLETPKFYPQYSAFVDRSMQNFCDSLLTELGAPADGPKCSIHVIYDENVDANAVLTEDGFAICLYSGLFTQPGLTRDMLLGIVAHQYAHGALLHSERDIYARIRRENGTLLGNIATYTLGFALIALAAPDYSNENISFAAESYYEHENAERIEREIAKKEAIYAYNYSVNQEYEADLAAFRFMQFLGKEDAYIEALKFLGADTDLFYANNDAPRPTVASRIAFLKYMEEHPEIRNTENDKLRKKRMKKLIVY
ncbi:MAG: M48 family metalloprotease [Bacteroidales bacterium]|nr:M48 family metalloprotease [Bacteroidales bacterium]